MKKSIQLHIQKLPEGVYLATSDDVQGLVVQENTLEETICSARAVAKMLLGMEFAGESKFALPVIDIEVKMPINIPLQLAVG